MADHQQSTRGRTTEWLKTDWQFQREQDDTRFAEVDCDDSQWESVCIPHDWAIAGPFDEDNDVQFTRVVEDAEDAMLRHVGRTGSLPHVGVGWYRRHITPQPGKRHRLEFDGVMSHSTVYVNGEEVGGWPYGYTSFSVDITDALRTDGPNVLAVRVANPPHASRWYPGAGIYRNVRLVAYEAVCIADRGIRITTEADTARIRIDLKNHAAPRQVVVQTAIAGTEAIAESQLTVNGQSREEQVLRIPEPRYWSPDSPHVYTAVTRVIDSGEIVDEVQTTFGLRTLTFDPNDGLSVNGQATRLRGVCMHHDLGPLGAAVNTAAIRRQLTILQDMGCNAIRTAHNPPAPELLDLCDTMGFLVIDEAFDEWRLPKGENSYAKWFDDWAERDVRAMIQRDANHPCVIMWSIGNEIRDQGHPDGGKTAAFLTDICHDEDPTRPVTVGLNLPDDAIKSGVFQAVDIPGLNYKPQMYARYHQQFPDMPLYGSETESTVSSRGEYHLPASEEDWLLRPETQVNSFDLCAPHWGYLPDVEFRAQRDNPWIMGEFVWTGFDYLGEPTPYNRWPARSSYFGIVDLCGLPKDRYYLYQSQWSDRPVLHLLPHWTWPDREGKCVDVFCYSSWKNCELFVNGKSVGRTCTRLNRLHREFRLSWPSVSYEPGELKVVAYDDSSGTAKIAAETVVRTAGPAARIELTADRTRINGDGDDMAFVTARVVDEAGTVCPDADHQIQFGASGPGEVIAADGGNAASTDPLQTADCRAFHGLCVAYIRAAKEAGELRIVATSPSLASASLQITVDSPTEAPRER